MVVRVVLYKNKHKNIVADVYSSSLDNTAHLISRTLDRHKIPHADRSKWKLLGKPEVIDDLRGPHDDTQTGNGIE